MMITRKWNLLDAAAVPLMVGSFLHVSEAVAQTPPSEASYEAEQEQDGVGEEGDIIVTAQKRDQNIQKVPMSISAADADQLKSSGIVSTDQLEKIIPGFVSQKSTYGLPVYYIRGVGFFDTTLGVSPAVTVYTDQIPLPYSPMSRGAVLDLERVEVLKGPQGTLFGQNSTGGAINYIAAKPTTTLQTGFDLSYGRFNAVDAEAFLSGPISDSLSARIAIRKEYQDGWQQNYANDDTNGLKDFYNGRLIVDWEPADTVKFEFSASGWRDRSETQQPQLVKYMPQNPGPTGRPSPYPIASFPTAPDRARAAAWDEGADLRRDDSFYQFGLRGDIDLGDAFSLTSISSYAKLDTRVPLDLDGTIYPNDFVNLTGWIKTFNQELRLNGSFGDSISAMVGANYQWDKVSERNIFDPGTSTGGLIGPMEFHGFIMENLQEVETKSLFGSVDVQLTPELLVQAAARYTIQDRDFVGCTRDNGDGELAAAFAFLSTISTGTPQTITAGSCATLDSLGRPAPNVSGSLDENNLAWRVGVSWTPLQGGLFYANVTKGYKSGSFPTLPAAFQGQLVGIKQESLLAYEAGAKLNFLDRRVQLNAAAFYYDYRDKQLVGYRIIQPFGNLPGLVSIPKSRVVGAEASLVVRPWTGMQLNFTGTHVDSKVQRNPAVPIGPYGNPGDFVGQSFPYTPRWQGVADAKYEFPVSTDVVAFLGGTVSARSSTKGVLFSGDPAAAADEALLKIKGYTLVDLRAGIEASDGRWRLEFWGRNVGNKFYVISTSRTSDYVSRYTGAPATYGVTLRFRFED